MGDFFSEYCDIHSISAASWDMFHANKDLVFVMFYHPCNEASWVVKDHFATVSQVTDRPDIVFAAVDCFRNRPLCLQEGAPSRPDFGVYKQGKQVALISDPYATAESLTRFIETFPEPMRANK